MIFASQIKGEKEIKLDYLDGKLVIPGYLAQIACDFNGEHVEDDHNIIYELVFSKETLLKCSVSPVCISEGLFMKDFAVSSSFKPLNNFLILQIPQKHSTETVFFEIPNFLSITDFDKPNSDNSQTHIP